MSAVDTKSIQSTFVDAKRREPVTVLKRQGAFKRIVQKQDNSIRYTGVCGSVKKAYYKHSTRFMQSRSFRTAKRMKKLIGGVTGAALGKLLDKQLDTATKVMAAKGYTILQYLSIVAPLGGKGTKMSPKRRNAPEVHPRTRAVLHWLHVRGWHPLACQVPVCCTATRRATMVDMICLDKKLNRLVLLELKSGFSVGYMDGKGILSPPFQTQNDSDHNRHQLQHLLTTLLFNHTFGMAAEDSHSAVLRVDEKVTGYHPLKPWALAGVADMKARFIKWAPQLVGGITTIDDDEPQKKAKSTKKKKAAIKAKTKPKAKAKRRATDYTTAAAPSAPIV